MSKVVNEFVTLPLINKRSLARVLWPSVKTANGSIMRHRTSGRTRWSKNDLIEMHKALGDLVLMANMVREAIDEEIFRD